MKTNNPSYDKLNLATNLEVGLFGSKLSHNKSKKKKKKKRIGSDRLEARKEKLGMTENMVGLLTCNLLIIKVVATSLKKLTHHYSTNGG